MWSPVIKQVQCSVEIISYGSSNESKSYMEGADVLLLLACSRIAGTDRLIVNRAKPWMEKRRDKRLYLQSSKVFLDLLKWAIVF